MATQTQETKKDKAVKPNHRYMRDKDREKVRGKFIFHEVPGGTMEFNYRAYKEDQVERYSLVDGEIYLLPLGVAKHLNKNCWYPIYGYIRLEGANSQTMQVANKVRRCSFQSLEFIDNDDLTPVGHGDVITVEKIGTMA